MGDYRPHRDDYDLDEDDIAMATPLAVDPAEPVTEAQIREAWSRAEVAFFAYAGIDRERQAAQHRDAEIVTREAAKAVIANRDAEIAALREALGWALSYVDDETMASIWNDEWKAARALLDKQPDPDVLDANDESHPAVICDSGETLE
jgi:hypothetical protein